MVRIVLSSIDETWLMYASPGRALGESSAWLAAGSILAMFHLSKATDHNGVAVEPSGRYISGLVR